MSAFLFCALLCAAAFKHSENLTGFSGENTGAGTKSIAAGTGKMQKGPPYVVALDAGHGGKDCGAQGVVDESVLTEKTVGFLEELLMQDASFVPVRTHPRDTFASPKERADAANSAGSMLLISIHGNAAPEYPDARGFECYPKPPGRDDHEESMRFAHLLADGFSDAGQKLRGEEGVRFLYYAGNDTIGYEKMIAEESDASVHQEQTFGLLERAECPAVLTEQCFVTCEQDAEQWGSGEGCRRAAEIIYGAICAYFGTQPR